MNFYMATKTLNDGNCDGDGDDSNTHKLNWTASNFDNFVYASRGAGGDRDEGQHTPIAWITRTQHSERSAKTVAAAWALAFVITKHTEPDCDCGSDSSTQQRRLRFRFRFRYSENFKFRLRLRRAHSLLCRAVLCCWPEQHLLHDWKRSRKRKLNPDTIRCCCRRWQRRWRRWQSVTVTVPNIHGANG